MKKDKLQRILFIPDTHTPYHDKKAVDLVHKVADSFAPDHIIIMGDFADFYPLSSHSKDPNRALTLKNDLICTKQELLRYTKHKAKNLVFIAGNHSNRLVRYLQDKAPELYNIISIPEILGLEKMGFKYVEYKDHYTIGKLNVTHDVGTAGRFAHYKALDTFQSNILIGHTHRLGYAVEGDAVGNKHVTAMFGWLGDASKADYMHRIKATRDWSLGFGIGYLNPKTGTVYVTPIPIVLYTCVVEGKLFSI